ncbi:MAG: CRP-like cAMP-binding protein [Saprospiraceae bacterium]|jgi:CRP-like cAMP-binding protein
MEESELKLIPKADFSMLLYNQRDFAARFIKLIASTAESTEQHLIDLAYSSVRYKVARAILNCQENDIESSQIQISREDLASMAGTVKETLIRTLSDLKKEGAIGIDGSHLTILNRKMLEAIPQ